MIIVESLINNVSYVVEFKDLTSLSISQAIAAKNTSEQVLEQVNNQKAAIDLIQALVQTLRDQSEGFSVSAGQSASSAQANKNATDTNLAQTLSALNSAVQIALGQSTGIAGIIPTARIRANSAFLSPEFTFTRPGSVGMVFNRQLRLVNAQANAPRFEFDPRTGEALGLLIESQKTNFILQSNDFGNASWIKSNSTVIQNSGASVDGQNNAWLLRESSDTTAANHRVQSNAITITQGTTYTFSVFAEARTRPNLWVLLTGSQDWAGSMVSFNFNLLSGTSVRASGLVGSSAVENLGNGRYRCSITITATAAGSTAIQIGTAINSTSSGHIYIGDGTSGLLIYGAQMETGGISSYIPTTTNAVTRNADDPLDQRIETVNPEEGTIIIRARRNSGNPGTAFFIMNNESSNNQISIVATGLFRTSINGVNYDISAGNSGIGVFDIYAVSYTQTRVAVSRNGGAVQSVAIPSFFTPTLLALRNFATDASKHIHTYQYLPKALTDAQLIVRSNPATFFGFENGDVALNADLSDAAFTNINAILRQPARSPMEFLGNGAAQQRIFSLDYAATLQLVHLPAGGTYSVSAGTTVVPGTTVIPAGTTITVDFNVPSNNLLILAFLPAIQ